MKHFWARRPARVAALSVGISVAVSMGMSSGASAAPLPDGYKKVVGVDGQVVQLWRSGETAAPALSMAANGAGRSAVVGGTVTTRLSKGVGNLSVGYLVGCQVDITGFSGGVSGSLSATGPAVNGSLSVPLTPGQVKYIAVTDKDFESVASVQWELMEIDVQQCGGQASARSMAQVFAAEGLNTDGGTANGVSGLVKTTLYGKPFSLN